MEWGRCNFKIKTSQLNQPVLTISSSPDKIENREEELDHLDPKLKARYLSQKLEN